MGATVAIVDCAKELQSLGLSVFPLKARGKQPIVPSWAPYQTERAPIDVLAGWWREYPDANIAVACGPVSGVLVLDVDGDIGREALAALEGKNESLPPTWRSVTGKGEHYWFRYPQGRKIGNSAHRLGAGLDTRGQGGYVVAPGSVHENGNEYRWLATPTDVGIAECPDWLLRIIDPPRPQTTHTPRLVVDNGASKRDAYLDRAINDELGHLMHADQGHRNDQLNRSAFSLGQLAGGGVLSENYIKQLLLKAALGVGLLHKEAEATIQSGVSKGMLEPRGIPALRFESSRRTSSPLAAAIATTTEIPQDGGLRLVSAAEIDLDAGPAYLLKGLVHKGDASVLYGQSGCGKTFFALYLAHAIATGRPIMNRRVRRAPVALFALEGSAGLAKRLVAIQSECGVAADLFVYRKPLTLFQNPGVLGEVIAGIKDVCASLVIFDTLSRTMSGANENAPEDMTYMVGVFDLVREHTGAHVMLVHHSGKNEALGARGHSSLRAAVDTEMEVAASEMGGVRTMRVTKGRDDIDGKVMSFNLKPIELGLDDDGDQVSTCVVEEVNADGADRATRKASKLTPFQAMFLKDFDGLPQIGRPAADDWVVPIDGMPRVVAASRETLVGELKKKGRLDASAGTPMSAKDRQRVAYTLAALEQKGLLCSTEKWVWKP
jgi:hypothetical protein